MTESGRGVVYLTSILAIHYFTNTALFASVLDVSSAAPSDNSTHDDAQVGSLNGSVNRSCEQICNHRVIVQPDRHSSSPTIQKVSRSTKKEAVSYAERDSLSNTRSILYTTSNPSNHHWPLPHLHRSAALFHTNSSATQAASQTSVALLSHGRGSNAIGLFTHYCSNPPPRHRTIKAAT